ncbi:MAG: flagellar type III secretion system pore protein FliP [Oscillospiraceae bacterium]
MTTSKHKADKKMLYRNIVRFAVSFTLVVLFTIACIQMRVSAAPGINIGVNSDTGGAMGTLEIMFMLMILALAPSLLVMMTSFTRIIIVLSFLRNALGTQQSPPNQVLIGLALFLSLFIMTPVLTQINTEAYEPYRAGTITQEQAMDNAIKPLKVFMLKQTNTKDLNLFLSMSKTDLVPEQDGEQSREKTLEKLTELGLEVIVPSFITSELKRAFLIGFLLFIPFLIIDMVVSSTLMSMGMVMLPPSMIALPFKLMMFVLVDGWDLLLGTLVKGFY